MYKKCFAKKGLALATIVLFIGMSVIPVAGDTETEKYADVKHTSFGVLNHPICSPRFSGQLGQNDWFINLVSIFFIYRADWVVKIWFSITEDSEPDWQEFDFEPGNSIFGEEGIFNFQYKYQDMTGNVTYGEQGIILKIDMTPPTITLQKTTQMIRRKIIFTANANGAASGVERVEFYLDGVLKENITSGDYEYIYTWGKGEDPGEHEVNAIVYDNAGHSNSDDSNTTSVSFQHHATILSRILQRMQSISQLFLQLLKIMVRFPFHW